MGVENTNNFAEENFASGNYLHYFENIKYYNFDCDISIRYITIFN